MDPSESAKPVLARAAIDLIPARFTASAASAPSALAILISTFAEGPARNRALGLFFAMSAAGGAVGLLGGGLVSALSW